MFCFNDTAATEIYTHSLHDALPISTSVVFAPATRATRPSRSGRSGPARPAAYVASRIAPRTRALRSEEHTSELQSRQYLVCRLLLAKKTDSNTPYANPTAKSPSPPL